MKRELWVISLCLAAVVGLGCPGAPIKVTHINHPDGGVVKTDCASGFCVGTIDPYGLYPSSSFLPALAVAQRADDTLGIAYFAPSDTVDGGYDILYRSWKAGVVSGAEKVQSVVLNYGVSIAFRPNGEPVVAYLGGDDDGENLTAWQNSDAVISERSNGTWTEHIAVNRSNEAMAGNPVSDANGPVVGPYPAIAVASNGTEYFAYRDDHFGQFEVQDYDKSDLEVVEGGPVAWTHEVLMAGGNNPGAWGGNSRMILAADQPAVVTTSVFHSASAGGTDVWFMKRSQGASSTSYHPNWANPVKVIGVGNTYSAPSLAYDATAGFGLAVTETSGTNRLTYQTSTDGVTWTNPPDPVFESGSGGWYPSLAFESATKFPHVAYYVCALTGGVAEGSCPPNEDELRIAYRTPVRWESQTVDDAGGFQPWLFFNAAGKRLLVYRDIRSAAIKVAVEQ